MFALIGGAVAVFVATNLDGFVLLTLLFATPGTRGRTVIVGQYLGLAILVAISAIGAVGLVDVPIRWVGLLGVIPVVFGVRALARRDNSRSIGSSVTWLGVVGLVVADGVDNVAVYTPVFRHLGPAPSLRIHARVHGAGRRLVCPRGRARTPSNDRNDRRTFGLPPRTDRVHRDRRGATRDHIAPISPGTTVPDHEQSR
jgi:Cadmium resistance transporter